MTVMASTHIQPARSTTEVLDLIIQREVDALALLFPVTRPDNSRRLDFHCLDEDDKNEMDIITVDHAYRIKPAQRPLFIILYQMGNAGLLCEGIGSSPRMRPDHLVRFGYEDLTVREKISLIRALSLAHKRQSRHARQKIDELNEPR